MNKCLFCEKLIEVIEKKKPKKYCTPKCRLNDFYRRRKLDRLQEKKLFEIEQRSNPLINAARGRDKNGVNNDELSQNKPKNDKPVRISGEDWYEYHLRVEEWKKSLKNN